MPTTQRDCARCTTLRVFTADKAGDYRGKCVATAEAAARRGLFAEADEVVALPHSMPLMVRKVLFLRTSLSTQKSALFGVRIDADYRTVLALQDGDLSVIKDLFLTPCRARCGVNSELRRNLLGLRICRPEELRGARTRRCEWMRAPPVVFGLSSSGF